MATYWLPLVGDHPQRNRPQAPGTGQHLRQLERRLLSPAARSAIRLAAASAAGTTVAGALAVAWHGFQVVRRVGKQLMEERERGGRGRCAVKSLVE